MSTSCAAEKNLLWSSFSNKRNPGCSVMVYYEDIAMKVVILREFLIT